ncbi:hypothetical protein EV44_g3466 [Erysiphe necator]|uniref:Uncharacterized protein n=1 Tax=Uncinula necator TaxID=52586 RepID=A0A0B1P8P7_UNCNE|nr:hypothetical protein EV44_g3466 [Erysiphe necator]
MICPQPSMIFDGEDIPIRNNKPNSQTSDDENIDNETKVKLTCEEDLISSFENKKVVLQEDHYSVQKQILDIPPKLRVNPSDIDESYIIFGKRTRKERKRPRTWNSAKELQRLHQSELPPPPSSWRELKNHPYSQALRNAMMVEYNALIAKDVIKKVKHTNNMKPIHLR